jgi:hypothetical protein
MYGKPTFVLMPTSEEGRRLYLRTALATSTDASAYCLVLAIALILVMNLRPVRKPVRRSTLLAALRQYIEVAVDSHELFTGALPQSELPSQPKVDSSMRRIWPESADVRRAVSWSSVREIQ